MRRPDRLARAAHLTQSGRSIVVFHRLGPKPARLAPPSDLPLPQALAKARTDAGLTRADLAAALGMTEANVARMETGKLRPSTLTLERLAEATGTRLRISFERPAARAN